jgi:molybdopterin-synthase adenylyltransferase
MSREMMTAKLLTALRKLCVERRMPDGTPYASLGLGAGDKLSERFNVPLRLLEIEALRQGCIPERYVRNFKSFSIEEQIRLLEAAVLLVGLGGLGGSVLEILLRAGVGRITAADGDRFEESNLNRQVLSDIAWLEQPKSASARERANVVNSSVEFTALHEQLDAPRMLQLAREADVVVDALGGLDSRPALWQAAEEAGKVLVSAAVAGDSGCVGRFSPGGPGPALLFGKGGDRGGVRGGDRATPAEIALGTQAHCVHVAAALQASEVIELLRAPVGWEGGESRVLFFDLRDHTFETVRF